MKGTQSKEVDVLYRAIVDYYSTMSAIDITQEQLESRNKILKNNGIICDSELDQTILELQEKYLAAVDVDDKEKVINIVETTIGLLS